jgi:hypothetical protein
MVSVGLIVQLVTHSLAVGLKMPYRALVVVVLGSLGLFMLGIGIIKLRSIILQQISDDGSNDRLH